MLLLLDLAAIAAALMAAWFWYLAGGHQPRRVTRDEELDAADINRIVVALHRAAILNRRAAVASAASATMIALRLVAPWLISLSDKS